MLRGLYTAASGMMAQQRKHDTITNNIANLNTPGFKQGNALSRSFPDMLLSRVRDGQAGGGSTTLGRLNTGVFAEENISIHAQGDLQETQNPFDFALVSDIQLPGAGFTFDGTGKYVDENGQRIYQPQALFTVMNAAGEQRYSLNGKFTVDPAGRLVNADGNSVLGVDGQPIVLVDQGVPMRTIKVNNKGQFLNGDGIPLQNAAGQPIALMLTKVDDPNSLIREGNGLYRINPENQGNVSVIDLINAPLPEDQVEVRQGFIERSNVDASQSMVSMMSALRAYEANQKVIQFYDKSMEKAANEIGRV